MENAYVREHTNLWATALTPKMHERTCGYWYTITESHTAHTAFRTREDMDTWLAERGLTLAAPLTAQGQTVAINGAYRTVMDRDRERFENLPAVILHTQQMDNGELTPAKITETDGIRSVHFMNVNYRPRRTYVP